MVKNHSTAIVRAKFFSERIVGVWNNLPDSVDFNMLASFIRTVKTVDFRYSWQSLFFSVLFVCVSVFCCFLTAQSNIYSVSQKKSPPEIFWHFFPNGWKFFVQIFTRLLYVPTYARLQIVI